MIHFWVVVSFLRSQCLCGVRELYCVSVLFCEVQKVVSFSGGCEMLGKFEDRLCKK